VPVYARRHIHEERNAESVRMMMKTMERQQCLRMSLHASFGRRAHSRRSWMQRLLMQTQLPAACPHRQVIDIPKILMLLSPHV
jgi:hypothetical protein